MLMLVLTWIGIALGTTLLLLMALGPAIVEMDGWFAQRRRDRARDRTAARQAAKSTVNRPVVSRPALFH
jgi:hypothetical protein